jgi:hypothetical protein
VHFDEEISTLANLRFVITYPVLANFILVCFMTIYEVFCYVAFATVNRAIK